MSLFIGHPFARITGLKNYHGGSPDTVAFRQRSRTIGMWGGASGGLFEGGTAIPDRSATCSGMRPRSWVAVRRLFAFCWLVQFAETNACAPAVLVDKFNT